MTEQSSSRDAVALWRYGIISSLLHPDIDETPLGERLENLALKTWTRPDKTSIRLSAETLRKWFYRFRDSGLVGLRDTVRNRKGKFLVPEHLQEAIREQRRLHPRWTLAILFEHLLKQGLWDGRKPSQSALYRFSEAYHLQRDAHREPAKVFHAFEFPCFGQLWMFDFMHGPKVWWQKQKRKVYLQAILDDCTRYIVAGQFHFSESIEAVLGDLQTAVRRFGIPQHLYSDNGSAYKSTHLKMVGARLTIDLPHTPPFRPQGRGKIERFFRTVQDRFLSVSEAKTLEALNQAFQQWLNEYHQTIHDGIGESPLAKRSQVQNLCRKLPDLVALDPLFYFEKRCRVYQHGVIRLRRREFEVPGCLPGSRVTVFYLPWKPDQVWYDADHKPAKLLNKQENARRHSSPGALSRKEAIYGQK